MLPRAVSLHRPDSGVGNNAASVRVACEHFIQASRAELSLQLACARLLSH